MDHHASFFDKIGAKASYWFGVATGLVVLFVVGFFVMLGIYLNGGLTKARVAQINPTPAGQVPSQPTSPNIELTSDDWVRGTEDAPITVVEYSDYDCPFCQRHHTTMKQLIAQYDGQVNWVYRHFPLSSLHPNAELKANAAECVGSIGGVDAFWAYSDAIFEKEEGGTNDELAAIAQEVGVNKSKFNTCLESREFDNIVKAQAQSAIAAGGTGTPFNIIIAGDQQIPVNGAVPFEQFSSIIDSLLGS